MREYIYIGDKLTDGRLKKKRCTAVLNDRGKCIVGKSKMLVRFGNETHVILRRLLRKNKVV